MPCGMMSDFIFFDEFFGELSIPKLNNKQFQDVIIESFDDFTTTFDIPIGINRRDKRKLLNTIYDNQKYIVLETLFPRKKKRGSKRRIRNCWYCQSKRSGLT